MIISIMLNERLNFVVKIHKNEHLPKNLLIVPKLIRLLWLSKKKKKDMN